MDKVIKKVAIIFVGVSFIGILCLTIFNQITKESNHTQAILTASFIQGEELEKETNEQQVTKKDTKEEKEEKDEDKTTETKEEEKDEEKDEESSQTTKQDHTQATKEQENNTNTDTTPEVISTVSVEIIGVDGVMAQGNVSYETGDTAYDVLAKLSSQKGISVSASNSWGAYVYVSAIGGLAERDYGGMSGWYYKVNGVKPDIGAGGYTVQANDKVVWYYEKD